MSGQNEEILNENVVYVGFKPSQLTGKGAEYLVRDGIIIARFFNGNLVGAPQPGNLDKTVTSAA